MILFENEKNQKEYFFYVSGLWEIVNNNARLIRSIWVDTKVVIRNICSFIMTLSHEAKQRLDNI